MPFIQLSLTEEQSKKLEYYKILKNFKTKQEAMSDLIDQLIIDVNIKNVSGKSHTL
jgi:hypothetical protein